jgi:L-threonylcarbamoyladenylate synthase
MPSITHDIAHAATLITRGELVALPTETVYGLGADATNETAVRKIFAAKGRPADHPLIAHVADIEAAKNLALDWPAHADALARAFWPGPMTLIVRAAPHVLRVVTGGQDTVGIRVPAHPVALALLRAANVPIAAPSANQFGHVSPTTTAHVAAEFGDELQCILEGGDCEVGVESTIIDCTVNPPRVLRPGRIRVADIERVLGSPLNANIANAPRVSGALASHYAPRTRTRLMPASAFLAQNVPTPQIGTITFTVTPKFTGAHKIKQNVPTAQIEHDLYADLRELDAMNLREIWIETLPLGEAWDAIRDRVTRAAHSGET